MKNILFIKDSELKSINEFLIERKIILHPVISPNGEPNFNKNLGRKYILILDRNIITKLVELCKTGTLKDQYLLKVISSLMLWTIFYGIDITAGLALMEYANNKQNDEDSSRENNIFLKSINFYSPNIWLDLATGRIQNIPKIELNEDNTNYFFNIKSEHFDMHYAEMLHIFYLSFQQKLTKEEKIIAFIRWNEKKLPFCAYTIVYVTLLFSNKIKPLIIGNELPNLDFILKKCQNQAWDLTYLSFWSTLYWDEKHENTSYLFSTMDKDLITIFINYHNMGSNLFIRCLGKVKGSTVEKEYREIIKNRVKPEINEAFVNNLIQSEKDNLINLLRELSL